jgi:hypothetical protein
MLSNRLLRGKRLQYLLKRRLFKMLPSPNKKQLKMLLLPRFKPNKKQSKIRRTLKKKSTGKLQRQPIRPNKLKSLLKSRKS